MTRSLHLIAVSQLHLTSPFHPYKFFPPHLCCPCPQRFQKRQSNFPQRWEFVSWGPLHFRILLWRGRWQHTTVSIAWSEGKRSFWHKTDYCIIHTRVMKAVSFYPYLPSENWQRGLLRTVTKTWALEKLLGSLLGYIPAQQYRSSQRLSTPQILSKASSLSSTFTPFLRAAAFLFFFAHLWTTKSFLSHKNVFIKSVSAFSLFLCIL